MTGRLIDDPEYIQGQIAALQALILGLAALVPKEAFREQALARLESAKTALLDTEASDVRLAAVDHAVEWVRTVTS